MIDEQFVIVNKKKKIIIDIELSKEYILLIDYNFLISDLKKSYNNNYLNIYNQFVNDFNRCKIYINKKKEKNLEIFNNYFEFLFLKNNYSNSDFYCIITQAIMGFALEKIYNFIKEDIIIGELENKKSLIFNINSVGNKITIHIKKMLRIIKINDKGFPITISNLLIKLYIPFYNQENIIIIYKILKNNKI